MLNSIFFSAFSFLCDPSYNKKIKFSSSFWDLQEKCADAAILLQLVWQIVNILPTQTIPP